VLVDRGFAPAGASRAELPQAPPAAGVVTVQGRIAVPPARFFDVGDASPQGKVWPHLDPRRFGELTGVDVMPIVIEATRPTGGDADLDRGWPPPETGSERNLGYMVQWYTFAALAAGLWLWFTFRPRVTRPQAPR
jgi:surfeit locus 1 family protein